VNAVSFAAQADVSATGGGISYMWWESIGKDRSACRQVMSWMYI